MKAELFAQRDEVVLLAQQAAENLRELVDHLARLVGIQADQRGHRVQRVEQKMRIDLAAERRQTGFVEAKLLLFQSLLVEVAVPDLDRQRHREQSGGVDGHQHPRAGVGPGLLQREDPMVRKCGGQGLAKHFGQHDHADAGDAETGQAQVAAAQQADRGQVGERA